MMQILPLRACCKWLKETTKKGSRSIIPLKKALMSLEFLPFFFFFFFDVLLARAALICPMTISMSFKR